MVCVSPLGTKFLVQNFRELLEPTAMMRLRAAFAYLLHLSYHSMQTDLPRISQG
jgi:hypothetical protein